MTRIGGRRNGWVGADADKKKDDKKEEGSFLTKPLVGPVPAYGVFGILAALVGGVWWYKHRK